MSPEPRTLPEAVPSTAPVRALVEEFRQLRQSGAVRSVDAFLARYPQLVGDKAALLDLAYEEFCSLEEAGAAPDRAAFCQRFPRYQSSLRRLLATHDVLRDLPSDTLDASSIHLPGPGEMILGYAIEEELGRGAFARVCTATETALGRRKVVIKIARGGGHEAGILGQLEHPNIVPVYSVQAGAGLTVVCMPYLGRTTLCDVLDRIDPGQLPKHSRVVRDAIAAQDGCVPPHHLPRSYVSTVTWLAQRLADALAYVHAKGIQHRDIKPSNVLISSLGQPMLLDFNLAAAGGAAVAEWAGTLPYMSPEQLDEHPSDGAADVFSLGVVIYELLTGVHPFAPLPPGGTKDGLRAVLRERHRQGARDIRLLNSDVGDDLAAIIGRCLALEPSRRPDSASLAHQLATCLWLGRRVRRWVGRHGLVLGIYAGLLALATFSGAVWLTNRPPYSERQLAAAHEAFRVNRYQDAIEHATQAFEQTGEQRTRIEALLVRARAHLRSNNTVRAATDLDEAELLAPQDGRILALRGYCYGLAGNHAAAVSYYEQATRNGFDSAAIYNNIGCGYLQIGSLVNARPWLDKAIAGNPNLQAAYINRALASMRECLRKPGSNDGGRADIEKAIQLGPASAELYKNAAWIVMLATKGSETETVLGHLKRAVELGGDPAAIRNDSLFGQLNADPRFEEVLRTPPGAPTVNAVRLLHPLE